MTIQVVNVAGVAPGELDRAIAEATWIFGKAGIGANWVRCGEGEGDPNCADSADGLTFSVGVIAKVPDFLRETGLGFALVYSGRRNHAGVVYSRVVELAQAHPLIVSTDQVLGYAMVHEIAHLIFGSTAHSATGILRAGCRPAELEAIGQRRLLFTSREIEALHAKLRERRKLKR